MGLIPDGDTLRGGGELISRITWMGWGVIFSMGIAGGCLFLVWTIMISSNDRYDRCVLQNHRMQDALLTSVDQIFDTYQEDRPEKLDVEAVADASSRAEDQRMEIQRLLGELVGLKQAPESRGAQEHLLRINEAIERIRHDIEQATDGKTGR